MTERVKVLFILGWARSGSTLLDQILGTEEGFFSTGELRWIWLRGLVQQRNCGCGRRVVECPFWTAVLERAYSTPLDDGFDAEEILEWQRAEMRVPHTFRLLRAKKGPPFGRPKLDAYAEVTAKLYGAIAAESGARVIVDSSKLPSDAVLLSLLDNIDVYFVHLIRDPRAVAYSWQRQKPRNDPNAPANMLRYGPVHSTNRWLLWNSLADRIVARAGENRFIRVRYEDLVASPQPWVRKMVELVGEEPSLRAFTGDKTIELGPNHTVAGNPNRFRPGSVTLREDDEWTRKLARHVSSGVTTIASPKLRSYGYPLRVPSEAR